MQETKKNTPAVLGVVLCLVLAILVASLSTVLFSDKITKNEKSRLDSIIALAIEGNAGYEDVGESYGQADDADTALYLVKSGTGGEDSYALLKTTKYRGLTVEVLCAFSYDGIISSVHLVGVDNDLRGEKATVEKSGMLSAFGGVSYDSELVSVKIPEDATNCGNAVVLAVNEACAIMKSVLDTEEVSG